MFLLVFSFGGSEPKGGWWRGRQMPRPRLEHLFGTATSRARNVPEPTKVFFVFLSNAEEQTQIFRLRCARDASTSLSMTETAPINFERTKRD